MFYKQFTFYVQNKSFQVRMTIFIMVNISCKIMFYLALQHSDQSISYQIQELVAEKKEKAIEILQKNEMLVWHSLAFSDN